MRLFCAIVPRELRANELFHFTVKTSDAAREQLEFLQSKLDCCLVIDGESLQASESMLATLNEANGISL